MEEVVIDIETKKELKLKNKIFSLENQIKILKERNSSLREKNKQLREEIKLLKAKKVIELKKAKNKIVKLEGNSYTWKNFDKSFPLMGPLIKDVAKHLKIDICEYRKSEANSWMKIYKKLDEMIKNETTTKTKFENYLKILNKSKMIDWSYDENEKYRPVIKNIVDLAEKYVSIRNYIDKNRGKIL